MAQNPTHETPSIYTSSTIILLDDEPENKIISSYEEKKIELARSNQKVRNFFLTTTTEILKKYTSSPDLQEYWKTVNHKGLKSIENQFLHQVTTTELKFTDTGPKETSITKG